MAEPFLVLGAMKSGTTTLHEVLGRHPAVDVVTEKEANSLHNPRTARRLALAIRESPAAVAGEVTAGYLQAPLLEQPARAAVGLLGHGLRGIAIVRDPFTRAVSHWQHWTAIGREDRELQVALLEEGSPYVAFSSYHRQLLPWVENLGAKQIHVLRLEAYHRSPAAALLPLWEFLGVTDAGHDEVPVHANAADNRQIASGLRGSFARSRLYRAWLRPVLPARARRSAAGSARVPSRAPATNVERAALRDGFMSLVADDQLLLAAAWPSLRSADE